MSNEKQPDKHDSDAQEKGDAIGLGSLASLDEELARAGDAAEALSNDLGQPDPPAQAPPTLIDTSHVPSPEEVLSDELSRLEGLAQTTSVELGVSTPTTPAASHVPTSNETAEKSDAPHSGGDKGETPATPTDSVGPLKMADESERSNPQVESSGNEASVDPTVPSTIAADQEEAIRPDASAIAITNDTVSSDQPVRGSTDNLGGLERLDDTAPSEPVDLDSNTQAEDKARETTNGPCDIESVDSDMPKRVATVEAATGNADQPEQETDDPAVVSAADRTEPTEVMESEAASGAATEQGGVESVAGVVETTLALDDLDAALAAAATDGEHLAPETAIPSDAETAVRAGAQADTMNATNEANPQEAVPDFMRDLMGSADEAGAETAAATTPPKESTSDAPASPTTPPAAVEKYQSQAKPGVVGTGMLGVVGSTQPAADGVPEQDSADVVNGEGANAEGEEDRDASGAPAARSSRLERLAPIAFQAATGIVALLDKMDRPLHPIGPRIRLVAGWAALATLGIALIVFLVAMF